VTKFIKYGSEENGNEEKSIECWRTYFNFF